MSGSILTIPREERKTFGEELGLYLGPLAPSLRRIEN